MAQLLRIRARARIDAIRPILYRGGLEWLCLAVRFGHKGKSRAKSPAFLQTSDLQRGSHSDRKNPRRYRPAKRDDQRRCDCARVAVRQWRARKILRRKVQSL